MYLGIDLGTTNVKAVVVEDNGKIRATGTSAVARSSTPDGGVEQDIEQIWEAAGLAIRQAVASLDAGAVRAIGVSSQGGSLQCLDANDRPRGHVVSWLDGRGCPFDLRLVEELGVDFLAEHIGHGGSSMTLGQVLRIREESPAWLQWPNRLAFVGDIIVGRLCGRRAHDPSSLSIAMLYNPWLRRADPQMLLRLGIEERQLPDLVGPATVAGSLRADVADRIGLRPGIPVSPAIHDQYAAALGTGTIAPGEITFGSGTAWVLLATTDRLARPAVDKAIVCHHAIPHRFGQMLPIGNGGSAIDWAMKLVGKTTVDAIEVDNLVDEAAPGSQGLRFWPLVNPGVQTSPPFQHGGRIEGITRSRQPCHFVRAVVEGLACELARHLDFLKTAGIAVDKLVMCGSATSSRTTPQIVADVTNVPIACVELPDVSAFGAAMIARTLADASIELSHVARQWSPPSRIVEPGSGARLGRELLDAYLAPFRAAAERAQPSLHPAHGRRALPANGRRRTVDDTVV
jgi:xylulokinase